MPFKAFLLLKNLKIKLVCGGVCCLSVKTAFALSFLLPNPNHDLIGQRYGTVVHHGDSATSISRYYKTGLLSLIAANPNIDFNHLKVGTPLTIPTQYLLPRVPRRHMVINLAELRLYYFPPDEATVITYPIGIGREGEETPIMHTRIIEKTVHPMWYPTPDTRDKALSFGVLLPEFIEPGPDNPLGDYAMRLEPRNYLIHGTNSPEGVGLRISGGCIRMYPEDIEQLFPMVPLETPVNIINQPIKVGWGSDGILYVEAHAITDTHNETLINPVQLLSEAVQAEVERKGLSTIEIDWPRALLASREQRGVPVPISVHHPSA